MLDSKIKMAIVGVGNAGCQAIDLAEKHGHSVFAINSSEKDLNESVLNKAIPSFIIGNKRGAGKNRETAKKFMVAELKDLFANIPFTDIVEPADIVIVTGSMAGGTGSGVGPLLVNRIQTVYPNKTVIFFGIMPKHTESPQAQFNTIECMREITSEKYPMPYLLADLAAFEDLPNDEAYKKMAEYIVDCANVIRGDTMHESPFGMIDESDLLTILNENGYMSVYHKMAIAPKDLDGKTTQAMLIELIKSNPAVQIQRDNVVRKIGIVINTPDQIDDPCKAGNFEELEKFVGYPIDIFVNYSITNDNRGDISLILSGMTKPIDRLSECTEIAKQCQALFKDRNVGSVEDELNDVSFLKDARTSFDTARVLGQSDECGINKEAVDSDIPDLF